MSVIFLLGGHALLRALALIALFCFLGGGSLFADLPTKLGDFDADGKPANTAIRREFGLPPDKALK